MSRVTRTLGMKAQYGMSRVTLTLGMKAQYGMSRVSLTLGMKAQYGMSTARQSITSRPVATHPNWVLTPLAAFTAVRLNKIMFFFCQCLTSLFAALTRGQSWASVIYSM